MKMIFANNVVSNTLASLASSNLISSNLASSTNHNHVDSLALPVLQQVFDSHFAHTSAHDLTSLAGLLEQNCRLSQVKALLQAILNTPAQLATIARRSYWHGNGFLKIVLLDQGYKLRLHIWFNGVACEENIHSHRWGFASHVLQGALRSEIWQDGTDNQEQPTIMADECRYTAKQGDTPAQKAFLHRTPLVKSQDVVQHAGNTYVMYPHELHKINHPGDNLVATMICTAPTDSMTNRLFPSSDNPTLSPAQLTPDELREAIERFLAQC